MPLGFRGIGLAGRRVGSAGALISACRAARRLDRRKIFRVLGDGRGRHREEDEAQGETDRYKTGNELSVRAAAPQRD